MRLTYRLGLKEKAFKWVQFEGEMKWQWGRVTGDRLLQIEGDLVKFAGRLREHDASRSTGAPFVIG